MTPFAPGPCPAWLVALGVSEFGARPGATEAAVAQAEQTLGACFPDDYRAFLCWSDGGEGWIGTVYARLWSTAELAQMNTDYAVTDSVPGAVGIGSNGGGECYALDYRSDAMGPRLVFLPFIGMDEDSTWVLGSSFTEGLTKLGTEPIEPLSPEMSEYLSREGLAILVPSGDGFRLDRLRLGEEVQADARAGEVQEDEHDDSVAVVRGQHP